DNLGAENHAGYAHRLRGIRRDDVHTAVGATYPRRSAAARRQSIPGRAALAQCASPAPGKHDCQPTTHPLSLLPPVRTSATTAAKRLWRFFDGSKIVGGWAGDQS